MKPQSYGSISSKRSLYAAYLLRMYLTLNMMGFTVSLPIIANKYSALEWYAVVLVAGSTASTIISAFSGSITLLLGRRITVLISTVGVIICSLLCAFSFSFPMFVAGYFLLNVFNGTAGTMPVGILVDCTDPSERSEYLSIYSIMNNVGTLLGPLLGGLVTDILGFEFTPIYPLPLALVTLVLFLKYYKQPTDVFLNDKSFDLTGGALLAGAVGSIIVLLNTAGKDIEWTSPLLWGLGMTFALCLFLFIKQEKRSANPIIPLDMFRIPSFTVANILIPLILPQISLSNNFTLLLIQTGLGQSATSSATYFIPKTLAIIIISLKFGRWISYRGTFQKKFVIISGALIGFAELMLGLTSKNPAFPTLLYWYNFLLGIGEGMYYMTLYTLYQRDLSPKQMPSGISTQFLLALMSISLTSTVYGIILSLSGNDIVAAYPIICYATLVPTSLYLLIASKCLHSPQYDYESIKVTLPFEKII
jgi:MFS family permease